MNIGIVGIGFMGMIHYLAYQKVRGAKVTAICTRDPKKLAGDWRSIKGNFGPPGAMMDLSGVARYARWEDLLADPKIDLVDVCLPPAMHAPMSIAALRAGKHVLVEKPIALEMAEARKMVQAAEKADKLLMIGHVLPFFPEYAHARKLIGSGKFGRMLGGHFKRIISDPSWLKDFYDPKGAGGPLIDLHIHDAHFIRLICGMPKAVFTTGRMRGSVPEFYETQFLFGPGGPAITASGGVIRQQGRSFTHAFEIYLERATLLYDFAVVGGQPTVQCPFTVLDSKGLVLRPSFGEVDGFAEELTDATKAIRTGRPSAILAGGLALDALALCHKQAESLRSGRMLKV